MSRAVVIAYKQHPRPPRQVGQELGVRAVVTGQVQRQGDRWLIEVVLTDVTTGAPLWRAHYTPVLADGQTVLTDIVPALIGQLRLLEGL